MSVLAVCAAIRQAGRTGDHTHLADLQDMLKSFWPHGLHFLRLGAVPLLWGILALSGAGAAHAGAASDEDDAPDLPAIARSIVDVAAYKLATWRHFQYTCGLPARPSRSDAGRAFLTTLEQGLPQHASPRLRACARRVLPTGKDLMMPGEMLIDWGRGAGLQIEMQATPWFPPAERDRLLQTGAAARGMGVQIVEMGEKSRAVFFERALQDAP